MRWICLWLLCGFWLPTLWYPSQAQTLSDTTKVHELGEVVITATRSEKALTQVSVPVTTITSAEIAARGRTRLSDVLADLPNLTVRYNFGAGIQLQGLDPAYTLILLDGEPLLGRTGGTLDLNRLGVQDIERIEVVRGPSSALYGSEALAGVVNIITRKPHDKARASLQMQYETHNTLQTNFQVETLQPKLGFRLSLNRLSSDGYNLQGADGYNPTVPKYADYTANAILQFKPKPQHHLSLSARWNTLGQEGKSSVNYGEQRILYKQDDRRYDWNTGLTWVRKWDWQHKLTTKAYASRFISEMRLIPEDKTHPLQATRFDQDYAKLESQFDWLWQTRHMASFGAGAITETVRADRVEGGNRTLRALFVFAQNDYVGQQIDATLSARLDVNEAYGTHLSPKISGLYKWTDRLRLRASFGSGFKAPNFQQLYLNFNNGIVGYSVFGAEGIQEGLAALQKLGILDQFIRDISSLQPLKPETAWSFNVGAEYQRQTGQILKINLFRNQVTNLIEVAPIAFKTNAQQVFTYFNLNEVYTQGIETELNWKTRMNTRLTASYQFLDTADPSILAKIDAKSLYTRDNNLIPRIMSRKDYGGLFNRSRHTASFVASQFISLDRLLMTEAYDFSITIRGHLTGRYGLTDRTGNGILDRYDEYVPTYMLWHLGISKDLPKGGSLRLGVENLFNHLDPARIPWIAGRLFYAGLNWTFKAN